RPRARRVDEEFDEHRGSSSSGPARRSRLTTHPAGEVGTSDGPSTYDRAVNEATVSRMLEGFSSLDEQLAAEEMTASQRRRYAAMVAAAVAVRFSYGVVRPHVRGGFDITDGLERFTGHELRAKGSRRA